MQNLFRCRINYKNSTSSSSSESKFNILFLFWRSSPPVGHGLLIHEVSRSHTTTHTTVRRTPLDKWSPRRRDLYLTTHNTHNRQTFVLPVGFEPTISAGEQLQTARPLGPAKVNIRKEQIKKFLVALIIMYTLQQNCSWTGFVEC